jgi:hypothetical protein
MLFKIVFEWCHAFLDIKTKQLLTCCLTWPWGLANLTHKKASNKGPKGFLASTSHDAYPDSLYKRAPCPITEQVHTRWRMKNHTHIVQGGAKGEGEEDEPWSPITQTRYPLVPSPPFLGWFQTKGMGPRGFANLTRKKASNKGPKGFLASTSHDAYPDSLYKRAPCPITEQVHTRWRMKNHTRRVQRRGAKGRGGRGRNHGAQSLKQGILWYLVPFFQDDFKLKVWVQKMIQRLKRTSTS